MGLLSIIRKIKRKEKEMRILMVGLDNSGKTTIVMKINGEDTSIISPTLGFNIKTISYQKYTLNIWDVGGQKTIRSYWRNYFEQTDGLVWVVDSSDLRRLNDCKYELDNLLKEERLSGASLLIFANKQDIQGSLSPDEIAKVVTLAKRHPLPVKAIADIATTDALKTFIHINAIGEFSTWKPWTKADTGKLWDVAHIPGRGC
ncbi:ADP-ribosylation factor-like protein 2 [Sesamum angolense]|uniref:ADP-ribosylation factor-like protein 2 n=1 Tax=Sesamum angolense TaxID=2727404 RepID=A0AAE2BQE5_9LAMI|nr:ADP-ribosylation factor-like protein 2 [Sesamum angolense]